MGLKLRNFTPLNVTIRTPDRDINLAAEATGEEYPRFGFENHNFAGVEVDLGEASPATIPMFVPKRTVLGLPAESEDTLLIVGESFANDPSTTGRTDLVFLGNPILDGEGQLEAFNGLCPGAGLSLSLKLLMETKARREARAELLDALKRERAKANASEPEPTQDEAKEPKPEPTSEGIKESEPEPSAA